MNCTAGVQTSLILGVALSLEVKLTVASNKFISEALCRQFSLSHLFFFNGRVVDVRCLSSACCGPSVGVFYSSLPPAVEPQNKRVERRMSSAASTPNWGKMLSIWSLHVGCC